MALQVLLQVRQEVEGSAPRTARPDGASGSRAGSECAGPMSTWCRSFRGTARRRKATHPGARSDVPLQLAGGYLILGSL